MKQIVVIGSSNTDMVVKSDRIPIPGETILGGEFMMTDGGKGANQAVAVARLGGKITFVARIGKDMFGDNAINEYKEYGIDTSHIARDETSSGIALIMVDSNAENCISVASGANAKLSKADVDAAQTNITNAEILLMQMEIPMDVICYAAEMAEKKGVKVILNPAPATPLPSRLYKSLYIITPNRTEAEILSGIQVDSLDTAKEAARLIADKGVNTVVITLGSDGSLILLDNEYYHIPARKVKAIDTTAAGDVFNGAMCVALSEGKSVIEAVKFATIASSISVTRMGAQSSIPLRTEVDALINNNQ